ncbi:MAG: ATP-binding protein [Dehalococcoidia bacterium]|nr:ATP-binding protein [Dehalococcoidia bacterium]
MPAKNEIEHLHIGWQLEVAGEPTLKSPLKSPLYLLPNGLKSNTSIIAQPGSGKSCAIGRFVEEVASKTDARFIILDCDSDFTKLSEVDPKVWQADPLKEWLGSGDTLARFKSKWKNVGITLLTNRDRTDLTLDHDKAIIDRIFLSWSEMTLPQKRDYLGLSRREYPEEARVLELIEYRFREKGLLSGDNTSGFTLAEFIESAISLFKDDSKEAIGDLSSEVSVAESVYGIQPNAFLNVIGRAQELWELDIWDAPNPHVSLPNHIRSITKELSQQRVLVIDLGSLSKFDEQYHICHSVLGTTWEIAQEQLSDAHLRNQDDDTRPPIFIVVEEAHNLAPQSSENTVQASVINCLNKISARGRKRGLALVLITQRPQRVNYNLLSSCDNLCLMKMNSKLDLDFLEKTFGFIPAGLTERALHFKSGEALLSGEFVVSSVYAHIAPRRTIEGGRNLQKYWAKSIK